MATKVVLPQCLHAARSSFDVRLAQPAQALTAALPRTTRRLHHTKRKSSAKMQKEAQTRGLVSGTCVAADRRVSLLSARPAGARRAALT